MSKAIITSRSSESVGKALASATASAETWMATHSTAHSSSEEHLEYLSRVDSSAHSSETRTLIAVVVYLPVVVHLLLLWVAQAAIRLSDFLELS